MHRWQYAGDITNAEADTNSSWPVPARVDYERLLVLMNFDVLFQGGQAKITQTSCAFVFTPRK